MRLGFAGAITILSLLVLIGNRSFAIDQSVMQGVWLAAVPLGVIATISPRFIRQWSQGLDNKRIACLLLLLLAPAAYAVGTGTDQWSRAVHVLIAWVGAATILVGTGRPDPQIERVLCLVALGSAALTAILVSIGVGHPYRSTVSLREQVYPTILGPRSGSILDLTSESASYLHSLREAAFGAGFSTGTPILDLTGRHPATVFALGGTAPGLSWLISGYPGSADIVRAALSRVSCQDLARAWLLIMDEKNKEAANDIERQKALYLYGLKPLAADTLKPLGIDPQTGYRQVISVASPIGYGTQLLLAPEIPEEATARCEAERALAPDPARDFLH